MSDHKHWAGQNGAGGGSFLCSYYTKLKQNIKNYKKIKFVVYEERTSVLLITDAAAKATHDNATIQI